ncbi:MAG: hypothetical protein AB8H79_11510 [Myxococcota bacterium]
MRLVLLLCVMSGCASVPPPIEVSISPVGADTRDDLVVTVQGSSLAEIKWYLDDEWVRDVQGDRVPASFTERGQTWRVQAVVTVDGGTSEANQTLTIANAPPVVDVTLGPAEPESSDALVVAAVARDADGDDLSTAYSWYRDDQLQDDLNDDRVPADRIARGETWRVEVLSSDGESTSAPASAQVSVLNGAPVLVSGGVTPEAPHRGEAITGWAEVEDPDGDGLTLRWDWYIGEQRVQSGESNTLQPGIHERGDRVRAVVVATDGLGKGEQYTVGEAIVRNSSPSTPIVRIVPAEPKPGEALRCELALDVFDPDGDPIQGYDVDWQVDGLTVSGTKGSLENDTIPAGRTLGEERWSCAVRASDGETWGAFGSASVEIAADGFSSAFVVAGRTVRCASVVDTANASTCEGITVDGKRFPNGIRCGLGWSAQASPWTDHGDLCSLITGSTAFQADYQCSTNADRVTWVSGAWGTRADNGYTESLQCYR